MQATKIEDRHWEGNLYCMLISNYQVKQNGIFIIAADLGQFRDKFTAETSSYTCEVLFS